MTTGALRTSLRHAIAHVSPRLAAGVTAARARAGSQRLVERWGLVDLNRTLIEHLGTRVLAGPFAGLRLCEMARREHLGPFLLGTYESELHGWMDGLAGRTFSSIADIGAKFGYYAVGLAVKNPRVPVVAFDTDWWARCATRQMAFVNAARNVTVRGYCSPAWVQRQLPPDSLVIADCEGFEAALFGAGGDALDSATLIVEVHDHLVPGVGDTLVQRFGRTHVVHRAEGQAEKVAGTPLPFLSARETGLATSELRPPGRWMMFEPVGRCRPI